MKGFDRLRAAINADAVNGADIRAALSLVEQEIVNMGMRYVRPHVYLSKRGRVTLHIVNAARQDGPIFSQLSVNGYRGTNRNAHGAVVVGCPDSILLNTVASALAIIKNT